MSRSRQPALLLVLIALVFMAACGADEPADLVRGVGIIHHMLQPDVISQSTFAVAFQDPNPSQFVSFIFSEMGALEWPATETDIGVDVADVRDRLLVFTTDGVAIVARQPDLRLGRQVVVSFDDDRGLIIVEGFEDPTRSAVLRREWVLPDVNPAPGVRALYQANQQAGMSCQAF